MSIRKKTIRIHYLQHVPFEGLGCISYWANQKGHTVSATKLYDSQELPSLDEMDWLIVLGGPMGIYDHEKYNWLQQEKQFIKRAIDQNKVVIGICLGSQLIADVLGAKVFQNLHKEIGWFRVSLTESGKMNSLINDLGASFNVFHWHGDTFELPKGAEHLYQSEGCKIQAFIYAKRVLGFQFHFEVTAPNIEEVVKSCDHEIVEGEYIQAKEELLRHHPELSNNNERMYSILNKLEDEN